MSNKSFRRLTCDQLCIEKGVSSPTDDILAHAKRLVEGDNMNRFYKKLPPRIPSGTQMFDFCYDIECYPNFFSCAFKSVDTGQRWLFEISEWKNDGAALYKFLMFITGEKGRMIGFNNLGYDYLLIHLIIQCGGVITAQQLNDKSRQIFTATQDQRFAMTIWENQRFVSQIDLMKIHHFDNMAKSTSLKMLENNMRSDDIKELPFDPLKPVTREQADVLISYNHHDVDETEKFFFHSVPQIVFRESLSKKYNRDFMNHNDTKIGKDYFAMELEKAGIPVKNVRTKRDVINVGDVILPCVKFEHPEFNRILEFFREAVMNPDEIKGFFKGVSCEVNGFQFDFGAGGLHASLNNTIIRASDTHELIDVDVASYYPNLAIMNKFFPQHLTVAFCAIYLVLYNQRVEVKAAMKGLDKNSAKYKELDGIQAMIKLALNGVYGDSNNVYSQCFYDPQYTMQITINGQLLLCMLAEQLMKIPDLIMVQCNTDGITFKCPKQYVEHAKSIYKWWEGLTGLELEDVNYSMMAISHVNSYLAVYSESGKVKRIGAYGYETALENAATREIQWHSDQSALVVPMAAEAALVHGTPISEFIKNHQDEYDFMLRTKVPRSSALELRSDVLWGGVPVMKRKQKVQNITRYYASLTGGKLVKVMPYTEKQLEAYRTGNFYYHVDSGELDIKAIGKKPKSGKYKFHDVPLDSAARIPPPREIGINVGQLVTDASSIVNYNRDELDYEFYVKETRKLVDPLLLNAEV